MKPCTRKSLKRACKRNAAQKLVMEPIAKRTRSAEKPLLQQKSKELHKQKLNPIDFHGKDNDNPIKSVAKYSQPKKSDGAKPSRKSRPTRKQSRPRREQQKSSEGAGSVPIQTKQRSQSIGSKRECAENEQSKRTVDEGQKRPMVFDDEVRDYIKEVVKEEVKKQMTQLMTFKPGEKWKELPRETVMGKGCFEKSKRKQLNISDCREDNELPYMSDVQEKEPQIELSRKEEENSGNPVFEMIEGTGKQGSSIEGTERHGSSTKQGNAEFDEDYQSKELSSHMEREKVVADKRANDVNGVVKKQKRNTESALVSEEVNLPFQGLFLDTVKEEQMSPNLKEISPSHKELNLKDGSQKITNLDAMSKETELTLNRDIPNSGCLDDIGIAKEENVRNLKMNKGTKRRGSFTKPGVVEFNGDEQSEDSRIHAIKKRVVDGVSVEEPFKCLLLDIQKEAQMPSKLENVFQNHERLNLKDASEENADLQDMWKDMELALKGDLLNSGSRMNWKDSEDLSEAEIIMYDVGCMGEHEFILDEEIGIICRVCKFVKQEIDGILPSLILDSGRRQSRKDYVEAEEPSHLRDLDFQNCRDSSSSSFSCPAEHSVWNLIPDLKENMYAHQQEGFEFLWRNLGGGLIPEKMKSLTSEEVGGCIISHAPGTGKTFLIISFVKTYLELFPRSRPLIIAPNSMLFPWAREFRKWNIDIPVYILNRSKHFWKEIYSDREFSEIVKLAKCGKLKGKKLKNLFRLVMVHEWHRKKSVLAVGYNLFVYLTCQGKHTLPEEARHVGNLLLESPGLLILDEGHQARNNRSKIWKALTNVNTKLRIILSGTLFQNNFKELFNTLYVVRPTFVDHCLGKSSKNSSHYSVKGKTRVQRMAPKMKESRLRRLFMGEIGNKIQNGEEEFDQCLQKFRSMTDDFVHCYEGKVLNSLPGLRDFTVILRLSSLQQTILEKISKANNLQRASNFEFETMVSSVSIHPSLYSDFGSKQLASSIDFPRMKAVRKDPNQGVKTKFVLDLVQLSQVMEEKVLLFSQNIPPLVLLGEIFETQFSWRKGKEILQLDGTLPLDERQSIIDQFNDPGGEARVLCASIRTCSEGITLIGASRVVFLDLVWNPAIVKQAVSRAFRLGQTKHVYVYRLIASGTMEEEKYQRTVWKDCLSKLIFVSTDHGESNAGDNTENIHCEDRILDKLVELDRQTRAFHTIFEHSELQGIKNPRSEYFLDYHNLREKFHMHVSK
eukprot:Gb_09974 [translate_table: standard]